jgi:hypothetical protein
VADLRFNALASGFHLEHVELSSLDQATLDASEDPWKNVAGVLLACTRGDFAALERLPAIMARDDGYTLWIACINLVGYAGTWQQLVDVVARFPPASSPPDAYFMALLYAMSCDLRSIDPLLDIYLACEVPDTEQQIRADLSALLEATDGALFDGVHDDEFDDLPSPPERERYVGLVRARRDAVVARLPDPTLAVFAGEVLDVAAVTRGLLAQIGPGSGDLANRFYRGQMAVAAMTGLDCSRWFDDLGRLDRRLATEMLEGLLASGELARFTPGRRFFFGHPVSR